MNCLWLIYYFWCAQFKNIFQSHLPANLLFVQKLFVCMVLANSHIVDPPPVDRTVFYSRMKYIYTGKYFKSRNRKWIVLTNFILFSYLFIFCCFLVWYQQIFFCEKRLFYSILVVISKQVGQHTQAVNLITFHSQKNYQKSHYPGTHENKFAILNPHTPTCQFIKLPQIDLNNKEYLCTRCIHVLRLPIFFFFL